MSVAILLDASSDLDLIQADEIGVDLLIQTVQFAGEVWLDFGDLEPAELYRLLDSGTAFPSNSPVSVEAYSRMLERVLGRASHVFAMHPNRYVEESLQTARLAAANFPGRVTVYESNVVSSPLALLGRRAAHLFNQGLSPAQVSQHLDTLTNNSPFTIYLDTTQYLRMSGELSDITADIPQTARPLLGKAAHGLTYLGGAATPTVGQRMMKERFARDLKRAGPSELALLYSPGAEELAEELRVESLRAGMTDSLVAQLGLVASAHLGPGAYGYFLFPNQR